MSFLGLHIVDLLVLTLYFAVILYLGVYVGGKKTETLGDFFVAGGKWGALVSFIFVFASAIAGNEAVVVSGQSYATGISGVWYWWSFLFATPVYYLFSTYYKRARVYNLAEFLEMRYSTRVAALYAVLAGLLCVLFIGMFVLAIAKILGGVTGLNTQLCVWSISLIVGAYVCAGGMMSALLTDLVQGVMCLFILGFVMLPFLWIEADGMEGLRSLPVETWNFTATTRGMTLWTVVALNLSALVGGIAAPWIYNWISVSRDEKAATQCGWGHLWKRIVTLMFALYGMFFFIYLRKHQLSLPNNDPEMAWGVVMKEILPVGVGLLGLLIASFFAAAMSSADTYATTSSAMMIDYLYRGVIAPGKSLKHYLTASRAWAVVSIILAAGSTLYIDGIKDYVKLSLSLLSFLGVPIYFGVAWWRANTLGMWISLLLGTSSYVVIVLLMTGDGRPFANQDASFVPTVFVSTTLSLAGMWLGSMIGKELDPSKLKRFYVLLATPIGQERRLVEAGIRTPSLIDAGLVENGPEQLQSGYVDRLFEEYSQDKLFGRHSTIQLRRERDLPWYGIGFVRITLACVILVAGTWLATRILFVW